MYGCFGFADSPRPWSMMCVSWPTVRLVLILLRAGTAGSTPPRPCGPWHCTQANWTNVCAPAATAGETAAYVGVVAGGVGDHADGDRDGDACREHGRNETGLPARAFLIHHLRIFRAARRPGNPYLSVNRAG